MPITCDIMKSSRLVLALICGAWFMPHVRGAETISLPNPGFEEGLESWWNQKPDGMSAASVLAAHSGKFGLRVTAVAGGTGSSMSSAMVSARPGKHYVIKFFSRIVDGKGIAVYLRFYEENGHLLNSQDFKNNILLEIPADTKDWKEFTVSAVAPANAGKVGAWVHSFRNATVTADFDDFEILESDK